MKLLLTTLIVTLALAPLTGRADAESLGRMGKKSMVVGRAAVYGAAGGLVVGLASQAFKKKTRNIFMFGSLGMYAGIIMGIYAVSSSRSAAPYEGPDTYDDYMGHTDFLVPEREQVALTANEPEQARVSLYTFKF